MKIGARVRCVDFPTGARRADDSARMKQLAENLWLLHYKLPILGEYLGRNVTVIRLSSGDLVIHSTAPFPAEDVAAISAVGTPAFLVEAITLHDTFAKEGRAAFPDVPYLAPAGFSETVGFPTEPAEPSAGRMGRRAGRPRTDRQIQSAGIRVPPPSLAHADPHGPGFQHR